MESPSWWQVTLTIQPDKADTIALALETLGAIAITYSDAADTPIYEPEIDTTPLWQNTLITGLFPSSAATEENKTILLHSIQQQLDLTQSANLQITQLADQEWTRRWLQYFKPMQFGANLWIIPDGFEPPKIDANNLFLDPGLAFGTGTHPTTSMCLSWIDSKPPKELQVLDFGCGSGILAIAAAVLGAKQVDAIDIDPQAIIATLANADKNSVSIHACLPDELANTQYDLVLANILASPLRKLVSQFARYCRNGGTLILSGILIEQTNEITSVYESWFNIEQVTQLNEWACIECRRH